MKLAWRLVAGLVMGLVTQLPLYVDRLMEHVAKQDNIWLYCISQFIHEDVVMPLSFVAICMLMVLSTLKD